MVQHVEIAKAATDIGSVGLMLATLLGWMPQVAAVLTVLWLGARLWNEIATAIYRARREKHGGKR